MSCFYVYQVDIGHFFVSLRPKNPQAFLKNGVAFATYQFRDELKLTFLDAPHI